MIEEGWGAGRFILLRLAGMVAEELIMADDLKSIQLMAASALILLSLENDDRTMMEMVTCLILGCGLTVAEVMSDIEMSAACLKAQK